MSYRLALRELLAELRIKFRPTTYFESTGEPKRCPWCRGIEQVNRYTHSSDGVLWEYSVDCPDCGNRSGFFAAGYWDPAYYTPLPLRESIRRVTRWVK